MSDIPSATIFLMAAFFYYSPRAPKWLCGIFFGLNLFVRATNLLLVIPFGLMMTWQAVRKQKFGEFFSFCLGLAPCALGVAGLHTFLYGSPFLTGYSTTSTGIQQFDLSYVLPHFLHYLKSLSFVYPLMFFAFFFSPLVRRFEILGVFVLYLVFYSCYSFVDHFPGRGATLLLANRFLFPVMPFLILGYGDVLSRILERFGSRMLPLLHGLIFVVLLGSAAFIHQTHQGKLRVQEELRDTIYQNTEEGSVLIYDRNTYELVQRVWGERDYVRFEKVKDFAAYAVTDKPLYLATRVIEYRGKKAPGIEEEDLLALKEVFVVDVVKEKHNLILYRLKGRS